jgi:transcriptional regulator NrdR family protein
MVCVYCGSPTKVTNSRSQQRANTIWRRRRCTACKAIVSTIEAVDVNRALIYRDSPGADHPFLREQLFISIYESCKHRDRAVSDAIELTHTILSTCIASQPSTGVIHRDMIITTSIQVLTAFDQAAGTHYAAFHRIQNN